VRIPFSRRPEEPVSSIGEMTLLGHLTELRKRLLRAVIAIALSAAFVFVFRRTIFGFLQRPYCDFLESQGAERCRFLVQGPLDEFSVMLTMAGYGGLILATPVVLYQLGRFTLPGLYPHEKRALFPFFIASIVLLAAGMTGGYLILPKSLDVLSSACPYVFAESRCS